MHIVGYRLPRKKVTLLALDAISCVTALFGAFQIRFQSEHISSLGGHWVGNIVFVFLTLVFLDLGGMYGAFGDVQRLPNVLRLAAMVGISCAGVALAGYIIPTLAPGRGMAALAAVLAVCLIFIVRWLYARLSSKGLFLIRTLIIGSGQNARDLAALLGDHSTATALVGYLSEERDAAIERWTPWLGSMNDLTNVVCHVVPDRIILAYETEPIPGLAEKIVTLWTSNPEIEILDIATVSEEMSGRLPAQNLDHAWVLRSFTSTRRRLYLQYGKRLLDLAGATIITLCGLPFLLAGIIVNWIPHDGPIMYSQERVGLRGSTFTIYKLRTMIVNSEPNGAVWSTNRDPRITRRGYYLRKFRFDELPQLWNIIKGDMSLVGPRPERPQFVRDLSNKLKHYEIRHTVPPGVTGWAQINMSYTNSLDGAKNKLEYDLYYVKHVSFALDLYILLRTCRTVFLMEGSEPKAAEQTARAAAAK